MNLKRTEKVDLLFFDRCELTYLFADLGNRLSEKYNIIHLAYSNNEVNILKEKEAIGKIIVFKEEIKAIHQNEELDAGLLQTIDTFFLNNTDGRFNLNSSMQSDRGFSILTYNECLLLAQIYYKFWNNTFEANNIKYVFHEPPSLFFNHMCAVMCKKNNAHYLYQIMTRGEDGEYSYINITGDNFSAIEIERKHLYYSENKDQIEKNRCEKFLKDFRSDYEVFLGNMIKSKSTFFYWMNGQKERLIKYRSKKRFDKLIDNIDYWLMTQKFSHQKYVNITKYKNELTYDDITPEDKYYYYSMHLEPEAVVLYLGDGIYTNQIKLIENIAAALPAGFYLYVKDHPHEHGYRSIEDYMRLKKIPNVKLLSPLISGKSIIKNSIGVFTINGTAGFEALLLNKQVYVFGKSYYTACNRVKLINNIRELKPTIYSNIDTIYQDDDELYIYVCAYLNCLHQGIVDFFMNRADKYGLDLNSNADRIAEDFLKLSDTFQ